MKATLIFEFDDPKEADQFFGAFGFPKKGAVVEPETSGAGKEGQSAEAEAGSSDRIAAHDSAHPAAPEPDLVAPEEPLSETTQASPAEETGTDADKNDDDSKDDGA